MDISRAKKFVFHKVWDGDDIIYISKTIQPIIDINEDLIGVYGVVDTESGEKMIKVEYDYNGEPIIGCSIFDFFLHFDYYMNAFQHIKKIYL